VSEYVWIGRDDAGAANMYDDHRGTDALDPGGRHGMYDSNGEVITPEDSDED